MNDITFGIMMKDEFGYGKLDILDNEYAIIKLSYETKTSWKNITLEDIGFRSC